MTDKFMEWWDSQDIDKLTTPRDKAFAALAWKEAEPQGYERGYRDGDQGVYNP